MNDGAPIFEIVLDRAVQRGDILQWFRDVEDSYRIVVRSSPCQRVLHYTLDQIVPFCDGLMLGGAA